jgi:hypothetical protein
MVHRPMRHLGFKIILFHRLLSHLSELIQDHYLNLSMQIGAYVSFFRRSRPPTSDFYDVVSSIYPPPPRLILSQPIRRQYFKETQFL